MSMTKEQVRTAINEGVPFVIRMADREYQVVDRYKIAIGRTSVVVLGEGDAPHILPLLAMTGISYLKSKG
jgi:hypothetical protein